MAIPNFLFSFCAALMMLVSFTEGLSIAGSSTVGINYGQLGDNLPHPKRVAQLLVAIKIKKVKLYDSNPEILQAFAKTGIELWVAIPNEGVAGVLDTQSAMTWIKQNLSPYLPDTKIVGISVGNEIYTGADAQLTANLVPAMQSVHMALVGLGLDKDIKVSSAHSIGVLGNSYPPSAGSFKDILIPTMTQHLEFLAVTGSPFWMNAYPFFAYKDNPSEVPLDYVLFQPNSGMVDPATNLHYDNMLYAQVDAVAAAIAALGYGNLEVRVSETGWPSKGDADEIGASFVNAMHYNRNLLVRLAQNQGTPMKPTMALQAYLFALFNENQKPGPTSERNYGLYNPNETVSYYIGLGRSSATTSLSSLTNSAQVAYDELRFWRVVVIVASLMFFLCSSFMTVK